MNGNFIPDTNIVIALFAKDSSVQKNLKKADEIFLSSIVLGELYYGALNSSRIDENIAQIEKFAAESVILVINASTAVEYGKIKRDLRLKGTPIPENDIWLAAITKQHNLTLVTRDEHFKKVKEIKIVFW